jgi:hypothetical protein
MVTKAPSQDCDDTPPKTTNPGSPGRFKGVPRGPARFTKREVARFFSAAERAGNVERVQLNPDGSLQAIFAKQGPATEPNPWDQGHASD